MHPPPPSPPFFCENLVRRFNPTHGRRGGECECEWLLYSASLIAKFALAFVLTLESTFSWSFHFSVNRKSISSSKNSIRDFQNSSPFERLASLCVTISGNFECFWYFNFETDFLENENIFQKTEVPLFSWKH